MDIVNVGDEWLFVVEKWGFVCILSVDGSLLEKFFLDIDSLVDSGVLEEGLLGIVFYLNYVENGYFFVNYIDNDGDI